MRRAFDRPVAIYDLHDTTGWLSVVVAPLLTLAIVFVGFLVLLVWVLAVSVALWSRGRGERAAPDPV